MALRIIRCALRTAGVRVHGRRRSMVAPGFGLALASLVSLASLAPTNAAAAQARHPRGAIYFQVIDTSVNPLVGAEVVLPHLGLAVQLAEEGSLLLVDVPNGMYLVQARHLGYKTEWQIVRVTGDTARAHFILMPAAHALDTVAVVADGAPLETRLRDFLRRSTSSPSGYFFTREDVDRRRPTDVGALLQTVSGVVVQRMSPGPTLIRSRRAADSRCAGGMVVFVDGLLVSSPGATGGSRERLPRGDSLAARRPRVTGAVSGTAQAGGSRSGARGRAGGAVLGGDVLLGADAASSANTSALFDVNRVPLSTLVGVEVYPTVAGVPPEFRAVGAECGVLLLWTAG